MDMYTDSDGETILEDVYELRRFAENSACEQCVNEAEEMLEFCEGVGFNGGALKRLVFSTTCTH